MIKSCDKQEIPLNNTTHSMHDMAERNKGFIAYSKNKVLGMLAEYCVDHRQHFVTRNLSKYLCNVIRMLITSEASH